MNSQLENGLAVPLVTSLFSDRSPIGEATIGTSKDGIPFVLSIDGDTEGKPNMFVKIPDFLPQIKVIVDSKSRELYTNIEQEKNISQIGWNGEAYHSGSLKLKTQITQEGNVRLINISNNPFNHTHVGIFFFDDEIDKRATISWFDPNRKRRKYERSHASFLSPSYPDKPLRLVEISHEGKTVSIGHDHYPLGRSAIELLKLVEGSDGDYWVDPCSITFSPKNLKEELALSLSSDLAFFGVSGLIQTQPDRPCIEPKDILKAERNAERHTERITRSPSSQIIYSWA